MTTPNQQQQIFPAEQYSGAPEPVAVESGKLATPQVTEVEEVYVDPRTDEVHAIDPDRPFTAADQAALDQQHAQKRETDAAMRHAVEVTKSLIPVPAETPVLDSATSGRKVTSHLLRTGHFGHKRTPR